MRGRTVRLSLMRRGMIDMLRLAASIPSIPVQRGVQIGALAAARSRWSERPSWVAIFAKAYDLVALEIPELRRAYLKLPWPHICEYPASVAAITVERMVEGEAGIFFTRIREPASQKLAWLAAMIRDRQVSPIEEVSDFRRQLNFARYPWPLRRIILWCAMNLARFRGTRFGTFGITTIGALDADIMHPRGPSTAILTYGAIDDGGDVDVRIVFDHRVVDGAVIGRALQRLEQTLNTVVLAELQRGEHDLSAIPATAE